MRKQAYDHFKDLLENTESDVLTKKIVYHMDEIGYNFISFNVINKSVVGDYSLTFQ